MFVLTFVFVFGLGPLCLRLLLRLYSCLVLVSLCLRLLLLNCVRFWFWCPLCVMFDSVIRVAFIALVYCMLMFALIRVLVPDIMEW